MSSFFNQFFNAQNTIKELQSELVSSKEDTAKVHTLSAISDLLNTAGENDKSLIYAKQALVISEKLKDKLT